jgi:hypothetical protein
MTVLGARSIGAVIGSSIALLTASPSLADEPVPPETSTSPEAVPEPSAQPNLLVIGGVVTAVWYGAAVGTSYLWSESPGAASLRIPVAGPYMALVKTGCGDTERGCGTLTVVLRTILTSLAAVGQTGGVLAMVEGVFLRTASGPPPRKAASIQGAHGTEIHVEPMVDDMNRFGFRLGGRF